MKPIALQLYTLREACAEDFAGTLKKVAEIGYKGVEFAGLHGMEPREVKAIVDDLGLSVCSSHVPVFRTENLEELIEQEKTLGNTRLVGGFGRDTFNTADDCKRAAERLAEVSAKLNEAGMTLGYHNHWWEFQPVEGVVPHEVLMSAAPEVFPQLDVYWVAFGGADPVETVRKYRERACLLHIKDGTLKEGEPHTAVGAGVLDMPAIIGAADPNVLEWLIVELDHCATDMEEAVRESYRYLTESGLAEGNK